MNTADQKLEDDARLLVRTAGFIALVFGAGVAGYAYIGAPEHGLLDAVYMTLITLTTVGYGEVIDLSHSPGGRFFTIALLVAGVGSFVYFFSKLTAFMVEGNLDRLLRNRKVRRMISEQTGHFIVCGAGTTGRHVVRELVETRRPLVVIDESEERLHGLSRELGVDLPIVVGDATDDAVLLEAGTDRARGLAACIASDKDNLIVTVSARILNPGLRIICRCIDERVVTKVRQAGADAVVSPNMIGGLRIVSELVRPNVVSFLDVMLRADEGLRVEEYPVVEGSGLAGTSLGRLRDRRLPDVLVVALREADGAWTFNPADDVKLHAGMSLVFMGSPSGRSELERLAAEG